MEWLIGFGTTFLGFILRIGIPLGFTILMVTLLKHLDDSWQDQAEATSERVKAHNVGCWLVHQCAPEQQATCDAYAHPEIACWQLFRQKNDGLLLERCLDCQVFRGAPIPASF